MSEVHTWSTAAASNTSAVPNGWPDTMVASGINNSAREMMAAIARWNADMNGSNQTSTSSINVYTFTPSRTISSYTDGLEFRLRFNVNNSSSATLNVSGLGAKDIKMEDGSAVPANYLKGAAIYHLRYSTSDGYFRIVGAPKTLGSSLSANGYVILPSGVHMQWGTHAATTSTSTITYSTAFPTTCVGVFTQISNTTGTAYYPLALNSAPGTSTVTIRNVNGSTLNCWYLALGY